MLDHPFGTEKGRLLQQLQQHYQETCTSPSSYAIASFPELYLSNGIDTYKEHVIKPFRLKLLASGDQTPYIVEQTTQELRTLGIWEQFSTQSAYVVEEMEDTIKSCVFLASHYYYHAMFHWFWRMFDVASTAVNIELCSQAADITFFEGKPMTHVKNYAELCTIESNDVSKLQRVWNKLAVQFALRMEHSEATSALTRSQELLHHIEEDQEEIRCRQAELHNAKALIYHKNGDSVAATSELHVAYKCLQERSSESARASEIRRLLDINLKRLQSPSPNRKV